MKNQGPQKVDVSLSGVMPAGAPVVLHVPFTFFPDQVGGTEVYVQNLAKGLPKRGYLPAIAAPSLTSAKFWHEGIPVYRFAIDAERRIEHAYGVPDKIAAGGFRGIVAKLQPAIVHLHARTAAVSEMMVDIAHEYGARVVFTYHTPTVSCVRGTMLLFGEVPCNGVLDRRRCLACLLSGRGVPRKLAMMAAAVPPGLLADIGSLAQVGKTFSSFLVPKLLSDGHSHFHRLMSKVDHVVAVCGWVQDVLVRNSVPAHMITLSRQGIGCGDMPRPKPGPRDGTEPIKLAFFGRLELAKGVDLLVEAMARVPKAKIQLDLYLVRQSVSEEHVAIIKRRMLRDQRITIYPAMAADDVPKKMATYDMIAVPSRLLETGPLVVLEAFSVGVPVLGAMHGGIAELVSDGIDGLLFPPNNVRALGAVLADLADDPSIIDKLRKNVQVPRSMMAVADDMTVIYDRLLSAATSNNQPANWPVIEHQCDQHYNSLLQRRSNFEGDD